MATLKRIRQQFKGSGKLVVMPFVPGGYPSVGAMEAVLVGLSEAGAGVIEVGIPFSDPIADGPVVQAAFTHVLSTGVRLGDVLAGVQNVRKAVTCGVVAMVSYSIAFRQGVEAFSDRLVSAGFDGVILPDLPPPEAEGVVRKMQAAGLETTLLVAPSTPPGRRAEIAALSSGFVYYLSVAGTTGERKELPSDLLSGLDETRKLTDVPLAVGFGISKREHLEMLRGRADGAIVGSALVRRMRERGDEPVNVAAASVQVMQDIGMVLRSLI